MKINTLYGELPGLSGRSAAGQMPVTERDALRDANAAQPGVRVTLSSADLSGTGAGSLDKTEVNMDKVERIRAQIQNGQFKPDASAIADKLIANAVELLKDTGSQQG